MLLYYIYEPPVSPGEGSNEGRGLEHDEWGTESCPRMQLPALVGKPWNVTGLFDSRISERSPKGLEHCQFQIMLTGYFHHAHLHIAAYVGHKTYNTGKADTDRDSPREACWL